VVDGFQPLSLHSAYGEALLSVEPVKALVVELVSAAVK